MAEAILACGNSRSNAELYGQPLGTISDFWGLKMRDDLTLLFVACR